ncbi:PetM of cytochrome b6/f complex subunit 7 [Corchorus capsularis]|uniref:PetM of cytochrome b6/f complex subunit 7 n=1 Tax=Corchorus capsularis TaxID=210143 RepID=A0A1R3HXY5_COCAP|nr:PetM of cytochrome b6/f complex subunit 7 [Corchorus capsularis]
MFATATVILRNCNCQCWQVEVNNCAGKMYFDKGWRKFIHENNIEEKHILVFINHGGSSVFDVTVFGANNCTKIVSPRVSKEQEVEFVDLVDDDEEEEEEKEEEQEQDEEWNDEGTNSMKGEDKELDIERYINHPNPYFVVKKSSAGRENELVCFLLLVLISYINELGLPAQMVPNNVIRVHELTLEDKEDITFIGLHNQKTIGKVKKWKDGRTVITGWSNFCYKNMQRLIIIAMATASATLRPITIAAATAASPRRRGGVNVKYITGLNAFSGLKAHNNVVSLGLPVCTEQCFAKLVSSLKASSNGKKGGALASTCSAVGEIFRIAAIMNGLVLVGVAVGFVLLRIEASVEEAEGELF